MERSNFVGNGGVRLPIGYRFHPTDEEIIVHYLMKKAFGLPLPASVIPEFDVFKVHPNCFPGDVKEKNRFFFGKRGWNSNGNFRSKRHIGSGYWKPVGTQRRILASGCYQTVGIRRTLVFCEGTKSRNNGNKTRWFVREYSLPTSPITQLCEDWVVYNVFQRQRKAKRKQCGGITAHNPSCRNMIQAAESNTKPNCTDFRVLQDDDVFGYGAPLPSSPCSSEVTEDFSNGI